MENNDKLALKNTLIISGKEFKNFKNVPKKQLLMDVVMYMKTTHKVVMDPADISTLEPTEEEGNGIKIVFTNRREGKSLGEVKFALFPKSVL